MFQIEDEDDPTFKVWFSPAGIIFNYLTESMSIAITGNINDYRITNPTKTDKSELSAILKQLTNEFEAYLINKFKPKYNKVLYKKYPNIKNGTKSLDFVESDLAIVKPTIEINTNLFQIKAFVPPFFLRSSMILCEYSEMR